MYFNVLLCGIIHLALLKTLFAVRCNTNPCQLDDYLKPPNYNCLELLNQPDDVFCTCPNGQMRRNAPCRVCEGISCGSNGHCLESTHFPGLYYACKCTTGAYNYINPGPCLTANTTISTTTVATTLLPFSCLNGGVYSSLTATCVCPIGFSGPHCETSIGQEICQRIICANNGVCNVIPTANSGFDVQCWCLTGFAGSNCELIGRLGRCRVNLCQNGGECQERKTGELYHAYCKCPPGFTGQYCEIKYFSCVRPGWFDDNVNCKFGRYFECIDTTAIIRACPHGLRFNSIKMQCDIAGSCP